MADFRVPTPSRLLHGSMDVSALMRGMPSCSSSDLWTRVPWRSHDAWMAGGPHLEAGIPYANIVWEALGLRDRARDPSAVAPWARRIRSHAQLGRECGILFLTDCERAAARYGHVHDFDATAPGVLDIVEDPHVRTHSGWIAIIRTGARVPLSH